MTIAKFFALQVNAISASQQMSLNQNIYPVTAFEVSEVQCVVDQS